MVVGWSYYAQIMIFILGSECIAYLYGTVVVVPSTPYQSKNGFAYDMYVEFSVVARIAEILCKLSILGAFFDGIYKFIKKDTQF